MFSNGSVGNRLKTIKYRSCIRDVVWLGRHADAGVGIGMPALVGPSEGWLGKIDDFSDKRQWWVRKILQKVSFYNLFNVFFTKTSRRRLCYHQAEGVGKIDGQFSRIKRSPEGLLDAKGGFEDESSYPKLKSGGRKVSFRCLLKSDGLKTCSHGFVRCFAAIWHIPNLILSIEV